MKIKYVFLSIFLIIALSLPVCGQKEHADNTKTDTKMLDMSKMMGKPTAEAIVDNDAAGTQKDERRDGNE